MQQEAPDPLPPARPAASPSFRRLSHRKEAAPVPASHNQCQDMLWPAAPISDRNRTALAGLIHQASAARSLACLRVLRGPASPGYWPLIQWEQKPPARRLEETENRAASPPRRYKRGRQAEWPYVAHLDCCPGVVARTCSSPAPRDLRKAGPQLVRIFYP